MSNNQLSDKIVHEARQRVLVVRARTWTLTIAILVSLALYIAVNVTTRQSISWIDFFLLSVMQILVHGMYFPDGDLFGQKDGAYISNKQAYNSKASEINEKGQIENLREYCDFEFEQRRHHYLLNQCALIGITADELEVIKGKYTEAEIKKLKKFENEKTSHCVPFSKHKRKMLYNLIFKPLPVQKNHPETIMSAVESDGRMAVHDTSVGYKVQSYLKKIFSAVVIGGVFAYIGYTLRDGFGFAQIVQICMYLTTMFSTAVTAFTSGETCSKVYKSRFYLELSNFIDGFNEWCTKQLTNK